ncbi:hypothetical protein C2S52_000930 [Perilla frutescens var. hirtella]|nr:hypothetical protein C2S51_007600 [Perilla frutescens var. frutescens]KAH6800466.1 hypothetical protein C2S52_000930 [Perilla frutescens var. hirtella]
MKLLEISQSTFVLTAKVVDEEAQERYKKGLIEFGSLSILMVILATLALLNLLGLVDDLRSHGRDESAGVRRHIL